MSDLLTDLQRELRDLNDHFASAVEQVLQLAPPVPVDSGLAEQGTAQPGAGAAPEELLSNSSISQEDFNARTRDLASGLVQRFAAINALIDHLPNVEANAKDEEARVAGLLKEHQQLSAELGSVVRDAEQKLVQVRGLCVQTVEMLACGMILGHGGGDGTGNHVSNAQWEGCAVGHACFACKGCTCEQSAMHGVCMNACIAQLYLG